MKLNAGLHLACSTNAYSAEDWAEALEALKKHTLQVRERACPDRPFGLGSCLDNRAAHELADRPALLDFQRWLGKNNCYVFTMNGFSCGQFHGPSIKEQIYEPDWRSPEGLACTNLLFDVLAHLVPEQIEASVSTLPCAFKGFRLHPDELKIVRNNLWHCVEHIARDSDQTGRKMHLGLHPEPLCLLESSGEMIQLFERMRAEHPHDPRLAEHLGVNYDTCHFAVEYEEPQNALLCSRQQGIRISKIHLSSALKISPTLEAREALQAMTGDSYMHQVVVRNLDANDSSMKMWIGPWQANQRRRN